MQTEKIEYSHGDIGLSGQIFRPSGPAKAAVAVFPTIMNPTPGVEAKAIALAEAGYLVMVCDFYGSKPRDIEQAFAWADDLRADTDFWRIRLYAGLSTLRTLSADLPMAAIGFCMGGQAVLELARDGAELVAVTSFHGLLETKRPAEPNAVKARILACHGDADSLVPRAQVLEFWQEMDRAEANWHFHSYSGVEHGFTNPFAHDGNANPAYDASADRQSWAAMLGLLDEALTD